MSNKTAKPKETPLMGQYLKIKAKYPDAVLLFRVGDFYETFAEDAKTASKVLGIALTARKNGAASEVALAGFPHHSVNTYLPKLVKAGYRVAICDQLEDPKTVKGIVKRGVTEVVTPGVALNDEVLNRDSNNFLASVFEYKGIVGLALLDVSTGEFLVGEGSWAEVKHWFASYQPSEILVPRNNQAAIEKELGSEHYYFGLDEWVYTEQYATDSLFEFFKVNTLKGFGIENYASGIQSSGAILKYLKDTQNDKFGHILNIQRLLKSEQMWMDWFTIRNLELIHPASEGGISLFQVLNHCQTAMGSRLLRQFLCFPLVKKEEIHQRLQLVQALLKHEDYESIRQELKSIQDLERILGKVSAQKAGPRDLKMLEKSLVVAHDLKTQLLKNKDFTSITNRLPDCSPLAEKLHEILDDEVPVMLAKGNVIRPGVNADLDDYRDVSTNSKNILLALQRRLIEETGISTLKVAYNNVFGYYIEVRNTHKDKVPEEWHRKQTLVNAERYIIPELKEIETKILAAEEKIHSIESKLFNDLCNQVCLHLKEVQVLAKGIALLDVLSCFAYNAYENDYVCPQVDDSLQLEIKAGRHPVIESILSAEHPYVPNDVYMDTDSQQIVMVTGPNMSGKSALLRQTALISIMAQIGSYVPASFAHIGIVDKIFTRVGASDNLAAGESTFMVEMTETSSILNNISERSLVLLDEIGRGTSTYDGISLAWAIAEYLHDNKFGKPKTLFATHYHELNEMANTFKRIKNFNVGVKEVDGEVIFLRKLKVGGSSSSFGLNVAKMAGMPYKVLERAQEILTGLESKKGKQEISEGLKEQALEKDMQLSFFQLDDPTLLQIKEEIQGIDINVLTPVEALFKLNEIKKILGSK